MLSSVETSSQTGLLGTSKIWQNQQFKLLTTFKIKVTHDTLLLSYLDTQKIRITKPSSTHKSDRLRVVSCNRPSTSAKNFGVMATKFFSTIFEKALNFVQ